MARRNHKKSTVNGFLLPPPVTTVVVIVSAVALAYIWLGCQCEAVGKAIKELEAQQLALKEELNNEQAKWAGMIAVPMLERTLRRNGIRMSSPAVGQVVQLRGHFCDGWRNRSPDAGAVARLHSGYTHE
jgi:hypothetical protein